MEKIPEVLQRQKGLEEKLKALGIPADKLHEALALFQENIDIAQDLEEYRQSQFANDAYEVTLLFSNNKSNERKDAISAFLRKFAIHVASRAASNDSNIESIVDYIPPMHPDKTEE